MKSSYDTFRLNNGYEIPCVGFGTWQTPDGETAEMAVSEAIKVGYRHIDTAACYGNEAGVGREIKKSGIEQENCLSQARSGTQSAVMRKPLPLLKRHWPILDLTIWICT